MAFIDFPRSSLPPSSATREPARHLQASLFMKPNTPDKVKCPNFGNPGYVKGDRRAGGGGSNGGGGKRSRFQGRIEKGDYRRG
jgi:hypothetical protein